MGAVLGYMCPYCGFDTDAANCDACHSVIRWDGVADESTAHCTGCGRRVSAITCRACGEEFDL